MLAPSTTATSGFRVLVLEDDRFFQEAIKKDITLTIPGGDQAEICVTAHEAIERVQQSTVPYSLATIDLHLPDGDGIEVIRHITKVHPETSILGLSVQSDEKNAAGCTRWCYGVCGQRRHQSVYHQSDRTGSQWLTPNQSIASRVLSAASGS